TMANSFPSVYGPNNHFNITNTTSHSGQYSLKFTYEAKNNICNTCGSGPCLACKSFFPDHIKTGHDGVNYFISAAGENLTIADNPSTAKKDDGPKALPGRIIYDRDSGFSKWEITSVTNENAINDKLNLKLLSKGINGEETINSGDTIAITRQCGVDGLVGVVEGENDVNRRSDCNSVIMWFANVTPQEPGTSVFRRNYLKSEVSSPIIHQKLHYLKPGRNGPLEGTIVLFADSNQTNAPNTNLQLTGMKLYGGVGIYRPGLDNGFEGLIIERSIWYYIEEEYQAATVKTIDAAGEVTEYNNNGAYKLWFSKAGDEPTNKNTPSFKLEGIPLPPIKGGAGTEISFWGNLQHSTHTRGSWYIDDVIISNTWNGPVPMNGKNISPANYPNKTQ
ncbi:MAG: hypothetical protein RQ982_01605, partial [Gammaproteobacteria bacterium]|nr:hypothetical protein [Gammaproteobacteria bacterium]